MGILLVVVRLVSKATDIVIAVNVPHLKDEYEEGSVDPQNGKMGRLMEVGEKVRERVCESFEVRDWGLFGEE